MTRDDLRALADALEPMAKAPRFVGRDIPAFCAYLRAQADAQPVQAVPLGHALSAVRHVGSANYPDRERAAIERLYSAKFDAYAHPAPAAPQAEPKREPLTYEQLVSVCYTYRHDFGSLDPDEQELVIEEAGRWAKAFGIGGSDAE